MDVKDIQKLMRTLTEQGLSELELHEGEFSLKLKRKVVVEAAPAPQLMVAPSTPATEQPGTATLEATGTAPATATPEPEEAEDLVIIESPIIGTFYRSPNPDADPYVNVGDTVRKGQVLCIIEAMKIMNEIEAEASGTIVKIFPKNGEAVEYGQKLFALRPM